MLLFLSLVCVLVYLLHKIIWQWNYWKDRGVPYVKPFPILGEQWKLIFKGGNVATMGEDVYWAKPEERYVGYFQMLTPVLMIRDPELIKQLSIKDFEYFSEHMLFSKNEQDDLFTKNLFQARTSKWKELRPTLSPAFTASKMKIMFGLIEDVALQLMDHFEKRDDLEDVELKNVFTRFANDVVATAAFGIKCNSLEEDNEFYLAGKELTNFTGMKGVKVMGNVLFPTFMKLIKVGIFTKSTTDFLRKVAVENIKEREEKGIWRPDMIQLMLDARKSKGNLEEETENTELGFSVVEESELGKTSMRKAFDDEDIAAQAMIFFLAGYEMVSTLMCITIHEMALHQEFQEKLRREIDTTWKKDTKLTYETIAKMKYLDMVMSEALRKWSPTILTERLCVKKYTLEPKRPGENPVVIDEGSAIVFPMWPIHKDEQYYPDPEKFDPERFSDENKHKITMGTFFPFGIGPRNCIGSRFALMETKILVAYVISHYEVFPTKKTQIPLKLKPRAVNFQVGGYFVGLKKRKLV